MSLPPRATAPILCRMRPSSRRLSTRSRAAVAVIAGVLLTGCNSPVSPSLPPPGAPPASLDNPSNALVTIEGAFAYITPQSAWFGYAPRFLLRETSGRSGATVEHIVVSHQSGADAAGPSCWRDALRVPAGGQLDTFHTEAGAGWLLYCAPGSGGPISRPELRVIVTFRDDNGIAGSVSARITDLR